MALAYGIYKYIIYLLKYITNIKYVFLKYKVYNCAVYIHLEY